MTSETERLAEMVLDLGRRLGQAFGDVISPEAQRHLRNAQREALTALFLIYEEQLGRRTGRGPAAAPEDDEGDWPRDMEEAVRRTPGDPDATAGPQEARPRSSRVKKIDLD